MLNPRIECPSWCRWPAMHQAPDRDRDGDRYVSHASRATTVAGGDTVELSRVDVVEHDGYVDFGDVRVVVNADHVGLSPTQAREMASGLTRAAERAERGDQ